LSAKVRFSCKLPKFSGIFIANYNSPLFNILKILPH
jgi:hypothetical protein